MNKAPDLVGLKFGRLTVLKRDTEYTKKDSKWICQCECGTIKSIMALSIKSGTTKSCGCGRKEWASHRATTHGLTKSPEHRTWGSMIQRCENINHHAYMNYGGRGISICKRWRESFLNFLADMGARPSISHSIDRINNNGNYEPSNCRWATEQEQKSNRSDNRFITFRGETMTISDLAKKHGITYNILNKRISAGWDLEKALTHPVKVMNREITYNNVTKTINEWSEISGIPILRLHDRIANGWSFEKAISQQLRYSKIKKLP